MSGPKRKERLEGERLDHKVSKRLKELGQRLDIEIEKMAGQRMTFALLIFNPIPGQRMNYISNGPREEMQQAIKSLIQGWEQGMPDIPAHEIDS